MVFNAYMNRLAEMTNVDMHNHLRADLVEHIWQLHAQSAA